MKPYKETEEPLLDAKNSLPGVLTCQRRGAAQPGLHSEAGNPRRYPDSPLHRGLSAHLEKQNTVRLVKGQGKWAKTAVLVSFSNSLGI